MANSAWSGNTAGLASATSAGLVGTGAQTFAGKKTLDGGALIKGDTSGNTIPLNYVGEKITWTSAPSSQSLTVTEADWTNASITLTAGTWLVQANISAAYTTGGVAGNIGAAVIKICDSSNNTVQNMQKQIASGNSASTGTTNNTGAVSLCFVANLSTASTVYKIRVYKNDANGTGSGTVYNQATAYSEFFGIRIA